MTFLVYKHISEFIVEVNGKNKSFKINLVENFARLHLLSKTKDIYKCKSILIVSYVSQHNNLECLFYIFQKTPQEFPSPSEEIGS